MNLIFAFENSKSSRDKEMPKEEVNTIILDLATEKYRPLLL
jgi:hypothetical protein